MFSRYCKELLRVPLYLGFALLADGANAEPVIQDPYAAERPAFAKVLAAQKRGQFESAKSLAAGHEGYPLYPYFLYNDLRRRLFFYPTDEVAAFLSTYADSYLAKRLRNEWLKQLVRGKRWEAFLDFYVDTDNTALQCRELQARIITAKDGGVEADTQSIWLTGESLPDECDPAFEMLYRSEVMNDELLWARMALAYDAGNAGLARYLARKLVSAESKSHASLWEQAHTRPDRLVTAKLDVEHARVRQVIVYALERLARQSITRARQAWNKLSERYTIDSTTDGKIAARIAVRAARNDDERQVELLDAVPATHVDAAVERYRLRTGIVMQAWSELARWTDAPPTSDINELRWRYWHARARLELGQTEAANRAFEQLADERDYYGFLAADRIGRDYNFNFSSIAASEQELADTTQRPGIKRARELLLMERKFQARREWHHELGRMNQRQGEIAAVVASSWQWHDQAIYALGKVRSYNDLEVRFPVLFQDSVDEYAARRNLDPARIFAIMRSESAFTTDARSPAGALGLMQLMPATARETARRTGTKLGSAKELYSPKTNISLGSAYLAHLASRYNGHFAMTAAAYNAGPHRVRRWRTRQCEDAEIWIESIPFRETRRYVRRAYFYAAVYEWRLQRPITKMAANLSAVPPQNQSAGQCS